MMNLLGNDRRCRPGMGLNNMYEFILRSNNMLTSVFLIYGGIFLAGYIVGKIRGKSLAIKEAIQEEEQEQE
jgi:hypothetical protein